MNLCSNCNNYEIRNKHFKLCTSCNQKRLNEAKISKSASGIRRFPNQKAKLLPKKAIQKSKFSKKIHSSRPAICTGCHNGFKHLTISHSIPVSLREDLEFEEKNVELECMDCHYNWEHGVNPRILFNFESKLEYIESVDPELYERKYKKYKS